MSETHPGLFAPVLAFINLYRSKRAEFRAECWEGEYERVLRQHVAFNRSFPTGIMASSPPSISCRTHVGRCAL